MVKHDGNKMPPRHFRHKHPLFRKSASKTGVGYTQSPYYYWWEFLRRHDGYKATCLNGGIGSFSALYGDFGDVHAKSFKEWWSEGDRGAKLFAEPTKPIGLGFIKVSDINLIKDEMDGGNVLLLSIPLTMDKKSILERFEKLLRKVHPRDRGERSILDTHALYPVVSQYTILSLMKTLEAFDLNEMDPKPKLWEIGQELKLGDTLTKDELSMKRGGISPTVKSKQNQLSVAASKKIKAAKAIIEGVGQGVFPRYK